MPEEFRRALGHAVRLLRYRERSRKELAFRLGKKGHGPEVVQEVLGFLDEQGLLDDARWARTLRGRAEDVRLLGEAGARRYLEAMGIGSGDAREALEAYDEQGVARRLVQRERRRMAHLPEGVRKRRILGSLRRRGFSSRSARRALREDIEEEDE
jgi:regulatory protein